jgi:ElaB/YqjD/DUF883 family membrane-anchored ribosome-binding protein
MRSGDQGNTGNLRDDIGRLRDEASNVARNAVGTARSSVMEVKDKVAGAVDTVRERGQAAADSLAEQIQDRPLTSVGIALGVGLVLGALLRRI